MAKKKEKEVLRCGMVSVVGRPNVGKSTLVNKILGEKVAIVSRVPQTTRNQVRGIYNDERGQIVFIDTPGLHVSKDKLSKFMNKSAIETIKNVDCIIHLVDSRDVVGREEEDIVQRLSVLKAPIILGLNKIDFRGKHIPDYISLWEQVKGKQVSEMESFTMLPLSGKDGTNIEKLLDIIFEYLPQGPELYPRDTIADVPQRMAIADIVREKLFNIMKHEVPHALAVVVDEMKPVRKKTMHINVSVIVERETQKSIVIGKNGMNLKKVGSLARADLEELLASKVFLEIYVKAKKKWRDNNSLLMEMGYQSI